MPIPEPDSSVAGQIVGTSVVIQQLLAQLKQVAVTDATVLLVGETGTGKEVLANWIHAHSGRCGRAMVCVNCTAIPSTLIESELFGHERGAFTDAVSRQIGRFEAANHSTIFLDEVGELPVGFQVKLLRVLEQRRIERLGSSQSLPVDVRIIAATNRNLEQLVASGNFREDLFYRLNVFPVQVPPLRDRVHDIPELVWQFVAEFSEAFGKRITSIAPRTMASLQGYEWPGNVRELRNLVERAMILAADGELAIGLPEAPVGRTAPHLMKLEEIERAHIRAVLEHTAWRIRGANGAAERLGVKPTTLESRMARLGVARPSDSRTC